MAAPAFVTGGAGFAGRHLLAALDGEVVAPSRDELELTDGAATRRAVAEAGPDRIFHLAAEASVGRSWNDPRAAVVGNLQSTLSLLEAARLEAPDARVVIACSGEEYGPPARLPVDESQPLRPQNPYATSKAACDLLAGQYADAYGLRIVRTRAFNHAGPGQSEDYVVGTLTRQVAQAEKEGAGRALLRTGNPGSARDFTDVRDVARAYVLASGPVEPGAYNVCSGRAVSVRELIELVREVAAIPVDHEVDPGRVRPHDVPEVCGSAARFAEATGWAAEIPLARTVAEALAAWRRCV